MDNTTNTSRLMLSFVTVFVTVFVLDFLVHALLLTDLYENTKSLWRPQEEYKFGYMTLSQLGFSALFAFIFTRNFEDQGLAEGLRFGLMLGLLLATLELGKFSYMPIPFTLSLYWMSAALVKGVSCGAVLSFSYKN